MEYYKITLEKDLLEWGKVLSVGELVQEINDKLVNKGFNKTNSRLVFSVCSDDCNRLAERETIEKALTKIFNREFHLGGLAAYPVGGVSGIVAASHHPPDLKTLDGRKERAGNLIIFASPHFGIIKKETLIYGSFIRPGQQKPTASCGAMMGFLSALKAAKNTNKLRPRVEDTSLDPSKKVLYKQLIANYSDRLNTLLKLDDVNNQVLELFKINHDLVESKLLQMIAEFKKKEPFSGNMAFISGITINTTDKDYFILKQIKYLN
ncbi:MAG: hypothetical protein JW891_03485 [Candidatus Lokiarchaeota archaeon]|nr:hypothetical protein [Candidatus Lokiarchaeota archaeon]